MGGLVVQHKESREMACYTRFHDFFFFAQPTNEYLSKGKTAVSSYIFYEKTNKILHFTSKTRTFTFHNKWHA